MLDLLKFYFSRLGEFICWIVIVPYLHNKISYLIVAPIFPSWDLSEGFHTQKYCVYIDVIIVHVSQYLFFVALLVKTLVWLSIKIKIYSFAQV